MAATPGILMIEFVESIAVRGEGKNPAWTVNDLGRRAGRFAWRIARHHNADNRQEILEGAKQIVADRFEEVRQRIHTKFGRSATCRNVGKVGGGMQVIGGVAMFSPVAPVGAALVGLGSVTALGSHLARLHRKDKDSKEIKEASEELFKPDESNDLITALHEIADLPNDEDLYDAGQPNVTKLHNFIQLVDTLFSYYHDDPTRIPACECEGIAVVQTIIDGVVEQYRKGFAKDLAKAAQCMLAARDSGVDISKMQSVTKVQGAIRGLFSTGPGVAFAMGGLCMAYAGKQGMAMAQNMKLALKGAGPVSKFLRKGLIYNSEVFGYAGPMFAVIGGIFTIADNVVGATEDEKESAEALAKAKDAEKRMNDVLIEFHTLDEPEGL